MQTVVSFGFDLTPSGRQSSICVQGLAELVGLPQPHVSAMESGAKFPNLLTVLRLAVALDCKVMKLVGVFDKTDLVSILPK